MPCNQPANHSAGGGTPLSPPLQRLRGGCGATRSRTRGDQEGCRMLTSFSQWYGARLLFSIHHRRSCDCQTPWKSPMCSDPASPAVRRWPQRGRVPGPAAARGAFTCTEGSLSEACALGTDPKRGRGSNHTAVAGGRDTHVPSGGQSRQGTHERRFHLNFFSVPCLLLVKDWNRGERKEGKETARDFGAQTGLLKRVLASSTLLHFLFSDVTSVM